MHEYIAKNKTEWEELERLVARARRSFRSLGAEEIARLDVLYRRTTITLSQVATRTSDQTLLRYLSGLTASAHAIIYLPPRRSIAGRIGRFIAVGFPRAFARTWRYHAASALLMLIGGVIAYYAVAADPAAAYAIMPEGEFRQPGASQAQLVEALRSGREHGGGMKFSFASFLFSHNLKVGFLSMATGILAGIPTILLLLYNGMIVGAFTATHVGAGIVGEYWAWILPHGITELGAIAICGGTGLLIGRGVISPGLRSRAESLRVAGREAARLVAGVAVMLVFAALIESYLRQSHLSTPARLVFAAASALFWAGYLSIGFRRRGEQAQPLADS